MKLDQIHLDNEFNCRGAFSEDSIHELANSMKAQGLINAVSVMANPGPPYLCIAGHRRVAAARYLGWEEIDAVIHAPMSLADAHRVNLQENLGRRDRRPSHEMRAIIAIYGDCPDRDQVAKELGRSKQWVTGRLRLREMEQRIIEKVDDGMLGALDIQYLLAALPGERWNLAQMLMEKKAQGITSRQVAASVKLCKNPRGIKQIVEARDLLFDYGRTPSWTEAMGWCAGEVSSEALFGMSPEKLEQLGINY